MHAITNASSLAECRGQAGKGVVEQHDIRYAARGLAATLHGDAQVRFFQREDIVHAIADHRDIMALLMQYIDQSLLLLWRDASKNGGVRGRRSKMLGIHRRQVKP